MLAAIQPRQCTLLEFHAGGLYSSDGFRMAFCMSLTHRHISAGLYKMFIVSRTCTAADFTVCMEMNQMLILQPCGGCSGCVAGSLPLQAM